MSGVDEGGGIGSTLVYDIGTYHIVQPHGSRHDRAADTSDEESDGEEPTLKGGKVGMNQERALAKAYLGNREKSVMTIELTGLRLVCICTFDV
jgi:hypothetical protein